MGLNATGVVSAKVTVTTAGTRVQLSSTPISVSWLHISTPTTGNTNNTYVGGSTVSATNGYPLKAGGTVDGKVMLPMAGLGMNGEELRLDLIYLDADTNGNFVTILYDAKVST